MNSNHSLSNDLQYRIDKKPQLLLNNISRHHADSVDNILWKLFFDSGCRRNRIVSLQL